MLLIKNQQRGKHVGISYRSSSSIKQIPTQLISKMILPQKGLFIYKFS
jgi:hypothetical protein